MIIADRFAPSAMGARLPEEIAAPGLLVGWSLDATHRRPPMGFTFGDPEKSPATGFVDPVLYEGEGHLITVAPTGAGKGIGCIIPALLRHPGSVIVIDPKGENAAITARRRREMGQQVFVLDPMGVTEQESSRLNPLDLLEADSPSLVDDAAALAQLLVPLRRAARDDFWIGRAQQLIIGVLIHVVSDLPAELRHMGTVRELVNLAAGAGGEALANRLAYSRHPEARAVLATLGIGANETVGGFVSFAQEALDFLRGPLLRAAMESSTLSLEDVTLGRPLAIYLVLPPHMMESHARVLRLWIGALMTAIMRRRARPARSTLFVLDEAAQLGPLPQLRQAVTLLRGYGLQTWSFWQDASQLRHLYPEDWQTMVNNCRVVQMFGANTMLAAEGMAALVGHGDGRAVLALSDAEMLLQMAGEEAVAARRPNYLTDPSFAGQYDANPYFDAARSPVAPPRPMLRWRAAGLETPELRERRAADRALVRRVREGR